MVPLNSYGLGVPQLTGTTYIKVKFPTMVDGVLYFEDNLSTPYEDQEQYPCYQLKVMNSL